MQPFLAQAAMSAVYKSATSKELPEQWHPPIPEAVIKWQRWTFQQQSSFSYHDTGQADVLILLKPEQSVRMQRLVKEKKTRYFC